MQEYSGMWIGGHGRTGGKQNKDQKKLSEKDQIDRKRIAEKGQRVWSMAKKA